MMQQCWVGKAILLAAEKCERRWLCQRVVKAKTALPPGKFLGHQKVLGPEPHCLTPQRTPGFDFRLTSGTTLFLVSPEKILGG